VAGVAGLKQSFSCYSQLLVKAVVFSPSRQLNHIYSWALPTIECPKTRSLAAAFLVYSAVLFCSRKNVRVRTTTHQHIHQTPAPRSFGLYSSPPTGLRLTSPDFMWNPPKLCVTTVRQQTPPMGNNKNPRTLWLLCNRSHRPPDEKTMASDILK
jgi:hypothetical protein